MTDRPVHVLSLVKKRDDIDRTRFRDHYESVHAPLAIPIIRPHRYVRHHLDDDLHGDIDFDVVTEFTYRSTDAAISAATAARESAVRIGTSGVDLSNLGPRDTCATLNS